MQEASAEDLLTMLTDKPNIIIATPPKRIRSRKPKPAAAPARIDTALQFESRSDRFRDISL
jgi:hypothetical protein